MQWIYWLIAVIVSAGAGYWVFRADQRRAVPYPWLTAALRSLVVFFTLLLILVPTITITKNIVEKPIVLLLQDDSRSVCDALGAGAAEYKSHMEALVSKLSDKYKVIEWGFGSAIRADSVYQYNQQATDIAAALERAREYYGASNLGAVILATDGRYNQGLNPLYQQLSLQGSLYTVGIGDSARHKDIRVTRVYANKVVTVNNTFEVRADIVAELCDGYSDNAVIKEGNETLSSAPVAISGDRSDRAVSFTLKAAKAGLHHYVVSLSPAAGEQNVTNNKRDVFVEVVDEQKNILIVSAAPHPDVNAIKEALSGVERYKVTVTGVDDMPASLSGYSVIIAHGLPSVRNDISARLQAAKKPTWFILTSQSSVPALNGMSTLTHASFTKSQPYSATAAFQPSFNAFTLPKDIRSVMDKMPPLTSGIGNVASAPGGSVLFALAMAGDTKPLWVLQQGAVPSAILAGEDIWRWRIYEYKNFGDHNVVDECIRQTVAFLAANNNEKPFGVSQPKYVWSDQEAITLNAYLLNANNERINTPAVDLTIADSAGRKQEFSFERSGTAYSLNIGIRAGGNYTYTARTTYNDKTYTSAGSFVVESVPLELMETGADYPLLYGLAKKYNGGFVPAAKVAALYDSIYRNDRVKPLIVTNTEIVPLVDRKWYFFIILLIAVGEWLLRKYWLAQ